MPGTITRRHCLRRFTTAAAAGFLGQQTRSQLSAEEHQPGGECVIDSHVHLKHGDAARTEYSPEVIVQVMDAVGIARSVVFAMSTTTQQSIQMAQRAVAKFPDRLIPFVYALPHYERPVIREIAEALAGGIFRGIKIHAGECTLAEYVIDPVLKLAGCAGVPCLVDCVGHLAAARRMARSFPQTTIIIAHMGRYLSRDPKLIDQFLDLAAECPNVFLDTSGVVLVEKISEAVERLGSERLIWGTDGPHPQPDLASFARAELDKIRGLSLSPEEKANILGRNIARLLRLS